MRDVLATLCRNSRECVDRGVYEIRGGRLPGGGSLLGAIRGARGAPVISEVKFSSPSRGGIREPSDPADVAASMVRGGAAALSVLTQPILFGGAPEYLARVRRGTDAPILMKDIVVDRRQIDAAAHIGADCILLISSLFEKGYLSDMEGYIEYSHGKGLEVLLEVHTASEMRKALGTDADLVGINNRNLDTLGVDLSTTSSILGKVEPDRPVVSESGISTPRDILYLRECGAHAFLVGSSIMESDNIESSVRRLVKAY